MKANRIICSLIAIMFLLGCGGTNSSAQLSADAPDFTLSTPRRSAATFPKAHTAYGHCQFQSLWPGGSPSGYTKTSIPH